MSCLVVAPFSAAVAAPALRSPCARPGTPASTHRSRNQFPKPQSVYGAPALVTRNVRSPVGLAIDHRLQLREDRNRDLHGLAVAVLLLGKPQPAIARVLLPQPD
jgi:hypothetical protein